MVAFTSSFTGRRGVLTSNAAAAMKRRVMARRGGAVSVEARRVAVLGAGGGIGQPLSLLLKMNKLVTELALYDIAGTPGVAADLSHCNTPVTVSAYTGDEELEACLTGADLVIIPAGIPRKPGMSRDDLFNTNAGIVAALVKAVAKHCPSALLNIITNPVNSTVPIAAQVLKAENKFDPAKLMGVTTLDVVRSNTFVTELKELDMKFVDVPVIGGHSGVTILPLLSKVTPSVTFVGDELEAMTTRIQNAGTEVVEAKAGKGSATLSMAYAAARMAESCLLGLEGEDKIYECTFVQTGIVEGCDFFSTKCRLGPNGVAEVLALPDLSDFEQEKLITVKEELNKNVSKGVEFAKSL